MQAHTGYRRRYRGPATRRGSGDRRPCRRFWAGTLTGKGAGRWVDNTRPNLDSPPPFLRYVLRNPWLWQVRSWLIYVAAFGLVFFAFDRPRESRLLWVGEVFLILLCLSVCALDRMGQRWLARTGRRSSIGTRCVPGSSTARSLPARARNPRPRWRLRLLVRPARIQANQAKASKSWATRILTIMASG